jgi:hypothetical protein
MGMASRSPTFGAQKPGAVPAGVPTVVLAAVVAAGATPAACGGSVPSVGRVGAEAIADAIERELEAQGVSASVVCPEGARVGASVTCTAIAVDDPSRTALVVRAEIVDTDRIAVAPEAALAVGRAAPAIRRALGGLGIEAARIDCGRSLARAGDSLGCDIEAGGGRRYRWDAVIGADGHARGELVAR